jgi:hypothetical protein
MGGRISYYGNVVRDGLILNLDAGKVDSYPRTGTLWTDLSGNGNNGTLTNFGSQTIWNGDNGGSIVFDGTNDYVDCGNGLTINTAVNTCTINVWFKQSTSASTYRLLTSKGPSDADENFALGVHYTNSKIYFDVGGSGAYIDTTYSYSLNTWYNVCVTHNRVAGSSTLKLYINGVDTPSTTIQPTLTPVTNNSNFIIGSGRGNSLPFPGNISLVYLYNRVLSITEVLQNYNALKGRYL